MDTPMADGWQHRTGQKLALAGCLAAALSLRSSPLRTGGRVRELTQKLVGYGGAALLFSGVQEGCRAARGRHDFLNTALSGAVTGGVVVGHYQGPQYRLLGVVTWGSVCALVHLANSLLQPRQHFEDYLIREGLLSPEVARARAGPAAGPESLSSMQQDVLYQSLAIKERELRQLNDRIALQAHDRARATSPHHSGGGGGGGGGGNGRPYRFESAPGYAAAPAAGDGDDGAEYGGVSDDDAGYLAWLRISGLDAEALLQPQGEPQVQQQGQRQGQQQGPGTGGGVDDASSSGGGGRGGGEPTGGDGVGGSLAAAPGRRSWSQWLGLRRRSPPDGPAGPGAGG